MSDRILWDGYDTTGADLSVLNSGGVLAIGDIDGNGILWDGSTTQYVGIKVSGRGLLDPSLQAWGSLWGQGILWDGGLSVSSGRVWSAPTTWGSLVWPGNLSAAGSTSPLFAIQPLTGLTSPVAGAPSPVPPTPVFGP